MNSTIAFCRSDSVAFASMHSSTSFFICSDAAFGGPVSRYAAGSSTPTHFTRPHCAVSAGGVNRPGRPSAYANEIGIHRSGSCSWPGSRIGL
jgi:hypothetical protein